MTAITDRNDNPLNDRAIELLCTYVAGNDYVRYLNSIIEDATRKYSSEEETVLRLAIGFGNDILAQMETDAHKLAQEAKAAKA